MTQKADIFKRVEIWISPFAIKSVKFFCSSLFREFDQSEIGQYPWDQLRSVHLFFFLLSLTLVCYLLYQLFGESYCSGLANTHGVNLHQFSPLFLPLFFYLLYISRCKGDEPLITHITFNTKNSKRTKTGDEERQRGTLAKKMYPVLWTKCRLKATQ